MVAAGAPRWGRADTGGGRRAGAASHGRAACPLTSGPPGVVEAPAVIAYPAAGATAAVVLVLPGGRADSFEPTSTRHLSAVRMRPFARSLSRRGRRRGLVVWLVRYRYRGWNGEEMSPVPDARWALQEVRRRHGDVPVVLVGHSMGGRTAMRVADDPSVRAVVALAPWLPDGEPVEHLAGRSVLIVHGTLD